MIRHNKLLITVLMGIGIVLCVIGFFSSGGLALQQGEEYIGSDWSVNIPSVSVITPFSLSDTFGNYLIDEAGVETNQLSQKTSLDLWGMIFGYSAHPFTRILGDTMFLTCILIFYFVSIWLRSNSLSLVTISMGIVLSVIGTQIAPEWMIGFILCLIIGIAAIFWRLFFGKR